MDNFNTTQQFLDPGFKGHETLTQITAELVLQMATHTRLPLDPREIAHTLAEGYDEIHPLVTRQGASETAAKEFGKLKLFCMSFFMFSKCAFLFYTYIKVMPSIFNYKKLVNIGITIIVCYILPIVFSEYLSRAIGNFTTVAEDFHEYYNGVPIEKYVNIVTLLIVRLIGCLAALNEEFILSMGVNIVLNYV